MFPGLSNVFLSVAILLRNYVCSLFLRDQLPLENETVLSSTCLFVFCNGVVLVSVSIKTHCHWTNDESG